MSTGDYSPNNETFLQTDSFPDKHWQATLKEHPARKPSNPNMKPLQTSIIALTFLLAASTPVRAEQFNVFLFTKTDGWHHKSINAAVTAMEKLSEKHHFSMEWHEDAARINEENLKQFDVVVFMLTTGDILNDEQKRALEKFVQSGKGFVGIHSASDTEYQWDWYTKMVGRSFHIHPLIQTAELTVIDRSFPGMERMPERFLWTDEWYEFGAEKIDTLNYILSVDESTFDPKADWDDKSGEGMGDFHPVAWYHEYDGGRAFYTGLGHMGSTYSDTLLMEHIYGGLYWAATGKGIRTND
jgi:type 1 glutamine amidotransferase